jgi:hypothetical protein
VCAAGGWPSHLVRQPLALLLTTPSPNQLRPLRIGISKLPPLASPGLPPPPYPTPPTPPRQDLGTKIGRAMAATGEAGGPLRAWPGGLAVCRTIGDADCPAATPVPALRTITLDPSQWGEAGGAALVICSDGVWDAWSSAQQPHDQVARYVRECSTAAQAAERVVAKATKSRAEP